MCINILNSRQIAAATHRAQGEIYDCIYRGAHKSGWIRLAAPLVAVSSSLLTVVKRISSVAETIIKGFLNFIAFPFTDKCEFFAGLNQLFVKLPMDVFALMLTPLGVVVGTVVTTAGILFNPKEYAPHRAVLHYAANRVLETTKDSKNIEFYSQSTTLLFT
ncbi:MAG: hypothetical protein AAGG81_01480 [Chlamydiota bacterium]